MDIFTTVHFTSGTQLDVVVELESVEAAVAWWQKHLSEQQPALVFRGVNPKRPVVINVANVAYVDSIEKVRPEADLRTVKAGGANLTLTP